MSPIALEYPINMIRNPSSPAYQGSFSLGTEGEPVEGSFTVARVTFSNPETGYAVVQLVPVEQEQGRSVTATGVFGDPHEGMCYRIQGTWHTDRRYGAQIRASAALIETPRSPQAIERYLAGASIRGLGPHHARSVVAHFGADVLRILDDGGRRLEEVRGIGPVRAAKIRESWAEHQGIHALMVNLQGVAGLSSRQAQRIYRELGQNAWQAVSTNPYLLAERISGFGFKTCDAIAGSLGVSPLAPQRLQASVLHVLTEALSDGHLWTTREQVLEEAAALVSAEQPLVEAQLDTLISQARVVRRLIVQDTASVEGVYLPAVAETEGRLVAGLQAWLHSPPDGTLGVDPGAASELVKAQSRGMLTGVQREAIVALLTGVRLVILTGGPGTGKTTTMRTLIQCLESLDVPYALCATTGRASKQLSQATERPAATVHRYLGIGATGDRQAPEPLHGTVLIIDEASMIDLWLMDQIVARLEPETRLFLIGDVDQLPPVGPGAVLHDLIEAGDTHALQGMRVVRLETIFRQEAGDQSLIVANCHRIRQGQCPQPPSGSVSDYYEMPRFSAPEALALAVDLAARRLPAFLGMPPDEVQVLSPVHGGEAGVISLNRTLQAELNPPASGRNERPIGRYRDGTPIILREGDKVRQTRNDYRKMVYNGDLGTVLAIDPEEQLVRVRYDDLLVEYTYSELDDLVHAWAMTVHAAQGSQWPAVVLVLMSSHYVMLERNILYTALSRAQRLAVLITQDRTLRMAVQRNTLVTRRTDLARRLTMVEPPRDGTRWPVAPRRP